MNESEYYAGEFTDADLNALADAGELYLEESGFSMIPTQEELKSLAREGNTLLTADASPLGARPKSRTQFRGYFCFLTVLFVD